MDVTFRARVVTRANKTRGRITHVWARSNVVTVTWEPSISILDASTPTGAGPTGQTIAFPVQLSAPSKRPVTVAYASSTYPDGMVITVRISGTIGLDGKASGRLDVTMTGRHFDGGPVNCDSGTVTWTAGSGPVPP